VLKCVGAKSPPVGLTHNAGTSSGHYVRRSPMPMCKRGAAGGGAGAPLPGVWLMVSGGRAVVVGGPCPGVVVQTVVLVRAS